MRHRAHLPCETRSPGERGIALLMVITVLVTLVLIAVPFAISMRQGRERTTSELAKGRADFEAQRLIDALKHFLGNTHPMLEEQRWASGERTVDADPTVDNLAEITPGDGFRRALQETWAQIISSDTARQSPELMSHLEALEARGLGLMNDDRGSIWTGVVEDANGKVNPNGGSPFLLGALLGSALLAEDLDPSAPEIAVEHVVGSKFPRLDNFSKDGGYIRIGSEVIQYGSFDGSVFRQCTRGALTQTPLKDNGDAQQHDIGTPVIDYAAYKVATHLIASRPGFLTHFANVEDLRSIAGWGAGAGLGADRLDRIRRFVSPWSRRESGSNWIAEMVVTNQLPGASESGIADELELRDQFNPTGTTAFMNAGTIVKIDDGFQPAIHQVVNHVGDPEKGQRMRIVTLAGSVDANHEEEGLTFEGGKTTVSAWAPYPVNINTAPVEILYACLANLHLFGADSAENIVVPELAMMIATRIVEGRNGAISIDVESGRRETGPFRHAEDYGRFLRKLESEGLIGHDHRSALFRNAVNPHDGELVFGTAPWCYRTLDVYHLEARVAVNSRGGEQMATAFRREIVEIGSDGKTAWTLDSQADFEERLSLGTGAKWCATHPFYVNYRARGFTDIQPAVRPPQAVEYGIYPSTRRSELDEDDYGSVRLEPARIHLPGPVWSTGGVSNHFDSFPFTGGWYTDYQGAFAERVRGALIEESENPRPRPFTVSFWWCPWSNSSWTAFDCGMEKFRNRYAIFAAEGAEGPELVFRVCAAPLQEKGAEIFVSMERLDYEPGTWYHIQATCQGEDPLSMQLFVDGVSVGRHRALTYLQAGIGEEDTEIIVEHTEGFDRTGAVVIGAEIVEYDSLNDSSFRECFRGARGTSQEAERGRGYTWPAGTPVRQLGYSRLLRLDVMRGGSSLDAPLGAWSAVAVINTDDEIIVENTDDPPIRFLFNGVKWNSGASFTAEVDGLWGQSVAEALEGFGPEGIAILGNNMNHVQAVLGDADLTSQDGLRVYGMELVHYRVQGSQVEIVERNLTARQNWPAREEGYDLVTTHTAASGGDITIGAYLVPISVAGSTSGAPGEDYLDPTDPTHQELLARWGGDGRARVLLGLPTPTAHPEVIAYDDYDDRTAAPYVLFVRDRGMNNQGPEMASGGRVPGLTSMFFNQSPPEGMGGGAADSEGLDEEEGELEENDYVPEAVAEAEREDVKTVEDPVLPEEDPTPDNSGGGDPEYIEEPNVFVDGIVEAVTEEDPGLDTSIYDGVQTDYREPPFELVRQWIRGQADGDPRDKPRTAGFRGTNGTNFRNHDVTGSGQRGALFLPCFRTFGGIGVGRNDQITITDGAGEDPQYHAAIVRWGDERSSWAALDAFIDARVTQLEKGVTRNAWDNRGMPRILKFPCGEMPEELPLEMEFGRSTISGSDNVRAFLDELHIWRYPESPSLWVRPTSDTGFVDAEASEITVIPAGGNELEGVPGYDPECGIVALDGELIVYRGLRREGTRDLILERCVRGAFGTLARPHTMAGRGRFVPGVPVGYLDGNLSRDSASVAVTGIGKDWPREGLVRVVQADAVELIHFTRRSDQDLILPESLEQNENERGMGLLRGRFGTDVISHDSESLVLWQPFRFWDRYTPRRTDGDTAFAGVYEHPESTYVQFGKRLRAGYWNRLSWEEEFPDRRGRDVQRRGRGRSSSGDASGFLDVIVLARFSPQVPWDSTNLIDLRGTGESVFGGTTSDERSGDALYVFDNPDAANRLGLESETAEFRFYFVYRPGAFTPQDTAARGGGLEEVFFENAWKQSPSLRSFTVEYTSRTSTLSQSLLD